MTDIFTDRNMIRVRGRGAKLPAVGSSPNSSTKLDALLLTIGVVILCFAWRLQDLFPLLSSLQIPMLTMAIGIGLYVLDGSRRRRIQHINTPLLRILAAFGGIIAIGIPFALYPARAFTLFQVDYIPHAVMLTALTAAAVRSEEDVRWLAGVHVAGGVVFCLVALTRYGGAAGGRLGNLVYYDANDLAMMLVTTFPFVLYFVLTGRKPRTKLLSAGALVIYMVTLIQTGSRGGFIGICVVGMWILVRYSGISLGKRLAAVLVSAGLLLSFGSADFWDRMETLLHPTQDYNWAGNSESGRMEVWKRGVGYMLDRPLLGVGARNFSVAEGTLSRRGQINQLGGAGFKWSVSHNAFLQVGAELGIVGLALFIGLFVQGFRISSRSPPRRKGARMKDSNALRQALRVSLIGFGVTAFFLTAAYKPVFFALMGLLAGLEKLDRIRRQPEGGRASRVVRLRRRVDSSPARSA